jgi:hypothetical protein
MIIVQDFIVEPLAKHQIAEAYPLIREALPKLDLKSWTRLATRLADPKRAKRCGILAVRRGERHASGLLYYRKEQDLKFGATLVADHFIALDLFDSRPVLAALIAALESVALDLDCAAIRSVVHAKNPEVALELVSAGHSLEGATLYKTLSVRE